MATEITDQVIEDFKNKLDNHPVYEAVSSIEDLQCFMEHHVYSVWDFMSLIKYLQSVVAPTSYPWTPKHDGSVRRFINELVLEEESDETHEAGGFASHFELYLRAMDEIGADSSTMRSFIQTIDEHDLDTALSTVSIPSASKQFTETTFRFIQSDQAHRVAAALALGREHIIPGMFRAILKKIGVTEADAPIFHFYLNRHIHLDEDFHAPLSLKLLNSLCEGESEKIEDAINCAQQAVEARLAFWDGVLIKLQAD